MYRILVALALITGGAFAAATSPAPAAPVDLARYAGTWYEIARLPMWFQRNCARDVTANYLLENGAVRVLNTCVTEDGKVISATGRARVTDAPVNRHLKVGFFSLFGWYPFEGDYWIAELDPDYRWVIVAHPERKYGWILSRTPHIDATLRADLDRRLKALGYDPAKFVSTPQTAP